MEESRTEILARTKTLLGITTDENDALLEVIIDEMESAVLSYCRLDVMPRQLMSLIPSLAARSFRQNAAGGVRALSEGERRVEYESEGADIFEGFENRLKPFVSRRVFVPSEVSGGDADD